MYYFRVHNIEKLELDQKNHQMSVLSSRVLIFLKYKKFYINFNTKEFTNIFFYFVNYFFVLFINVTENKSRKKGTMSAV